MYELKCSKKCLNINTIWKMEEIKFIYVIFRISNNKVIIVFNLNCDTINYYAYLKLSNSHYKLSLNLRWLVK